MQNTVFSFSKIDRVLVVYNYNRQGEFTVDSHAQIKANTGLPANSTLIPVPRTEENEKAYFFNGNWVVTPLYIGRPYWDAEGVKGTITSYPQHDLPKVYTLVEPPENGEDFVYHLVDGEWTKVADHRGKIAFAKARDYDSDGYGAGNDYQVEDLGDILDTHTLLCPQRFERWNEAKGVWVNDTTLEASAKAAEEQEWIAENMAKIRNLITDYTFDQTLPADLRSVKLTEAQYHEVLADRNALLKYRETKDFLVVNRPVLSGNAKY